MELLFGWDQPGNRAVTQSSQGPSRSETRAAPVRSPPSRLIGTDDRGVFSEVTDMRSCRTQTTAPLRSRHLPRPIERRREASCHALKKIPEVATDVARSSLRKLRRNRQSTSVAIRSCRFRLFAGRAGVHVDFHANRHFNDFWSLPSHFRSPLSRRDGRLSSRRKDRTAPKIAQAGICMPTIANDGSSGRGICGAICWRVRIFMPV
jgi:hypothetical protein